MPADASLPLSVLTALDEYRKALSWNVEAECLAAHAALLHSLREMSADTARMDYVDAHLSGGDLLSDPPTLAITVPNDIVFNSTDSARAILDAARTPQPETRP